MRLSRAHTPPTAPGSLLQKAARAAPPAPRGDPAAARRLRWAGSGLPQAHPHSRGQRGSAPPRGAPRRPAAGLGMAGGEQGPGAASQGASGEPQAPGSSSRAGLWRCRGDKCLSSLERGHGTKGHLAWVRRHWGCEGLRSAIPSGTGEAGPWWALAGLESRPGIPCPESSGASPGQAPSAAGTPEPALAPGCAPHSCSTPCALYVCPLVTTWQLCDLPCGLLAHLPSLRMCLGPLWGKSATYGNLKKPDCP